MCEEDMAKLSFFEVVTTDFTVDTPVEVSPCAVKTLWYHSEQRVDV